MLGHYKDLGSVFMSEKQLSKKMNANSIVRVCITVFFLLTLLWGGCASQEENIVREERLRAKAAREVKREMGPVEQMTLTIRSDKKLNWYDNTPHPLILCVYQLSSPGAFAEKQQGKKGIGELLSCGSFDSSVLSHRRFTIQPSKKTTQTIYRMDRAKYLGIVAGYFAPSGGAPSSLITFDNTAIKVTLGKGSLTVSKTGKTKGLQ